MNRLSFLDLAFFITESENSPKHVAGLFLFKKPPRSKPSWVRDFYLELASHDQVKPPFDHLINFKSIGGPSWKQSSSFDIYDHLFYHSSKKVLKQKQLYALAAQLHEPVMDRSIPLWEC
ncbi:MAG: wax ester/triacylglycerol synthase family O-acyltransferase, partial [Arenicella sp.]|nr:wax ester/triacylglycerol synthase family O-acyltransferase [Arenicella sp.]